MLLVFLSVKVLLIYPGCLTTDTQHARLIIPEKPFLRTLTTSRPASTGSKAENPVSLSTAGGGTKSNLVDLIYSECVTLDTGANLSPSKRISSFKVDNLHTCWNYCKYTRYCYMFTFHTIFRTCSLHKKHHQLPEQGVPASFLLVGLMNCFDCLRSFENIREESGVFIVRHDRQCLAATNKKVKINDTEGYHLIWKPCSMADTWVIDWVNESSSTWKIRINTISILNSTWRMVWKIASDHKPVAYLTDSPNINNSDMIIVKANWIYDDSRGCTFNIEARLAEDKSKYLHLEEAKDSTNLILMSIFFVVPYTHQPCPARQFAVKNSKVLNRDRVPFFLPNKTVTVHCKPGFGVRAHNFTSYQKLKCSKGTYPKRCTAIMLQIVRTDHNFASGIILSLSFMLFMCPAVFVTKNIFCNRKKVGVQQEVQVGSSNKISFKDNQLNIT